MFYNFIGIFSKGGGFDKLTIGISNKFNQIGSDLNLKFSINKNIKISCFYGGWRKVYSLGLFLYSAAMGVFCYLAFITNFYK